MDARSRVLDDGSETIETNPTRNAARIALGLMLTFAGISHLTFARRSFKAQVPPWLPLDPDKVVLESGAVEIALAAIWQDVLGVEQVGRHEVLGQYRVQPHVGGERVAGVGQVQFRREQNQAQYLADTVCQYFVVCHKVNLLIHRQTVKLSQVFRK